MAAIGTLPVLFATGIHASRPAASAVGKGGLYSCTTHSLVYQTDGSSWTTWANLAGTGGTGTVTTVEEVDGSPTDSAVTKIVFPNGTLGIVSHVATYTPSVAAGALLAVVLNTAGGNKTTTSATAADVDAVNALVTFTAPASGNVLVRVTVTVNTPAATNANAFLGLRESTTDIVNSGGTPKGTFIVQGQTGNAIEQAMQWVAYLTGVSAGSHTYKLSYAANSSMSFTLRASAANPMTIEVWAA